MICISGKLIEKDAAFWREPRKGWHVDYRDFPDIPICDICIIIMESQRGLGWKSLVGSETTQPLRDSCERTSQGIFWVKCCRDLGFQVIPVTLSLRSTKPRLLVPERSLKPWSDFWSIPGLGHWMLHWQKVVTWPQGHILGIFNDICTFGWIQMSLGGTSSAADSYRWICTNGASPLGDGVFCFRCCLTWSIFITFSPYICFLIF